MCFHRHLKVKEGSISPPSAACQAPTSDRLSGFLSPTSSGGEQKRRRSNAAALLLLLLLLTRPARVHRGDFAASSELRRRQQRQRGGAGGATSSLIIKSRQEDAQGIRPIARQAGRQSQLDCSSHPSPSNRSVIELGTHLGAGGDDDWEAQQTQLCPPFGEPPSPAAPVYPAWAEGQA